MKRVLLITFIVATISVCSAYDKRVAHVIEQLRDMKEIGSDSVGYAGTPHDFYSLYRYCWYASTDNDLVEMLHDTSPVVRIMGAKCILTSPYRRVNATDLSALLGDSTSIVVGPGGCMFFPMTVGDVVGKMKRDPDFLGPREPRRPNKSPDPTARSVMPPASAGDRAAAGRGSS